MRNPLSVLRFGLLLVALALVSPVNAMAQGSCGLCKKHTDGKCNVPTINDDCGCCPKDEE